MTDTKPPETPQQIILPRAVTDVDQWKARIPEFLAAASSEGLTALEICQMFVENDGLHIPASRIRYWLTRGQELGLIENFAFDLWRLSEAGAARLIAAAGEKASA